jgi:type II secretory pathway component GspD/PulD (secretin)
MDYGGHKLGRSRIVVATAAAMALLWVGGCEGFFAQESAGVQAESIINELSGINPVAEPNISIPQVYKEPPEIIEQIVGGKPEFKLFYFCNYHTSDELKQVVYDQFATALFDEKGKSTRLVDYTVSSVAATNQLIVRCPNREDAEAVLEVLERADIAPTQVKIDCIISEVYADKTLDWSTTLEVQELFGEQIWAGPSGQPFGMAVDELLKQPSLLPAFPGASMREIARARMGLQVGYASEKYLGLVDILESHGYLKILMNPSLEVVNGKTAKVSSSQKVPLQRTTLLGGANAQWVESKMEYEDVVDSLQITPHVFAQNYIGLETTIILGSKLTPEGVKQLPIITKKEIDNKENRIRQGESLVIGGMRKSERRDVRRGVPFLKDLPVIGILFSGSDFEERVVETIFILTPTISTGGRPNREVVEELKSKHKPAEQTGALSETLNDPLGVEAGKKEQQRKADEAEQSRLQAEAEKAEARHTVREANVRTARAETQAQRVTAEVANVRTDSQKLIAQAKTTEEKAVADAKQAQAELEKAKAELAKAKTDAQTSQSEIEKLKEQVKQAEQKAAGAEKRAQPEIQKSKAQEQPSQAEAKNSQTETGKGESDQSKQERKASEAEGAKKT